MSEPAYRSGFVTFVGRPNVGKSTLTNALVGEKVAITSSKPQTTRRAIRGIVHTASGQLIIVDTPGIHRPRTLLGERLNSVVTATLGDVDVIGFCLPADEKIGPGDRFINEQLEAFPRAKKVAIVTKIDAVSKHTVGERLLAVSELRDWEAIVPVSSTSRIQLDVLATALIGMLPAGPALYPVDAVTDETLEARIGELIREAALEGVSDELPHSLAVTIDDMVERDDKDLVEIYANLWVERDSQKGIVIGRGGERLQDVGARARAADRTAGRQAGVPVAAGQGRERMAARPETAGPSRILTGDQPRSRHAPCPASRIGGRPRRVAARRLRSAALGAAGAAGDRESSATPRARVRPLASRSSPTARGRPRSRGCGSTGSRPRSSSPPVRPRTAVTPGLRTTVTPLSTSRPTRCRSSSSTPSVPPSRHRGTRSCSTTSLRARPRRGVLRRARLLPGRHLGRGVHAPRDRDLPGHRGSRAVDGVHRLPVAGDASALARRPRRSRRCRAAGAPSRCSSSRRRSTRRRG